jgi:HPt (histidine-containing phosphotransfer) domain-containing protein
MGIDKTALQNLMSLIGDDVESHNELIQSFIDEAPGLLSDLHAGLDDSDVLGRAAHTLKSSAADFGATSLSEFCATLEQQCKRQSVDNAEAQVKQIQIELDSSVSSLRLVLTHGIG